MKFLVDEQLPIALARAIAAAGHEARHVFDDRLHGQGDPAIWHFACDEGRVIVTKDADFVRLQSAFSPPRGKVLWVRLANCRKAVLIAAVVPALAEAEKIYGRGQWLVEIR